MEDIDKTIAKICKLADEGKSADAIKILEALEETHPEYFENDYLSYRYGCFLCEVKNYEKAEFYLTKAVKLDKSRAFYHYQRGICLEWLGESLKAAESYGMACMRNPNSRDYWEKFYDTTELAHGERWKNGSYEAQFDPDDLAGYDMSLYEEEGPCFE